MAAAFYGHVACYPQEYRSGTLAVIARSGGLRPWAAIITAAALAVLVTRGPTAVIVLGAALCGWSAGLLAAVATGETLSPAGAVWPMGLTALLLWGVGRRPEGR